MNRISRILRSRILFVDDEEQLRASFAKLLTGRGYDVITAENGQAALDILIHDSLDIILLDLKMPVMSGEKALDIIRAKYPDLPVIIVTGHGDVNTAVECIKKGAYDFVTKPLDIEPFLLTVARATEKRKLDQRTSLLQEENERNLYDLNLEKSRLKTIINCMPTGIMVTNYNLELVLHNAALMRMLDVSREISAPSYVAEIINDDSLIKILKGILDGKSHKKEIIFYELHKGENVLRAISAPIPGPGKDVSVNIAGTVTVIEDITAFKQLDRMKSDFVNMVAHELRSPLVAIRQMNSVLSEGMAGPLGERQQDFVDRGIKKIDALLELINDLLDVAKIEEAKHLRSLEPVNIGRIIEEIVALMEPQAREQGINLGCACQDLRPVLADHKNIEEIFNNLISNAVKYSPEGGQVNITAKSRGEHVEITVKDTGVGIPPEELPKIFEKFYRVKHPKTRMVTGTGLGLAIVKGLVDAHHGTIEVESIVDKGTTLRVRLPIFSGSEA
ncbi:MAG: response regulator [Deltaproteobacteria bacterium]|nr:response regulator [Deltaproteobacteria bacterium]